MSKRLLALLLLFCLAPAVMADGLPDLGEASQVYLTPAMEKRIGKQAMQEIRLSDPTYLDDPEITGYINRLGMRLVAQSSDAGQTFKFFVLKDSHHQRLRHARRLHRRAYRADPRGAF